MSENKQGITHVEVASKPSHDYQGVETRIRYDFGRPVLSDDVVAIHAKLQEFVNGLAQKQLEQLVARANAEADAEVSRQQSSQGGTSGGGTTTTSDGVEWKQASKPNGDGTLRYRPTSNLSQDAFKAMIAAAIEAEGDDPEAHIIFDERTGKYGLESGNKRWSAATVKPSEGTPAYDELTYTKDGKTKTSASYFVDFESDGTVSVTQTNKYQDALEAVNTESQGGDSNDEEVPF